MYMIMRAVQILALVVFLWGSANDNAQNLVGNGAPILVWGSFAVMIIRGISGRKRTAEKRRGDKRTDHGGK